MIGVVLRGVLHDRALRSPAVRVEEGKEFSSLLSGSYRAPLQSGRVCDRIAEARVVDIQDDNLPAAVPVRMQRNGDRAVLDGRLPVIVLVAPPCPDRGHAFRGRDVERVARGRVVAVDPASRYLRYRALGLRPARERGDPLLPEPADDIKRGYRSVGRGAARWCRCRSCRRLWRCSFRGALDLEPRGFRQREGVVSHTITAASSGRTKPIRKSRHPRSHRILQGPFVVPYDPQSVPDVWHSGGRSSMNNSPIIDGVLYCLGDTIVIDIHCSLLMLSVL